MKPWYKCRRTIVGLYGLTLLFVLGLQTKAEVAGAMATIVLAIAGANAAQSSFESKNAVQSRQSTPPS